jgi:hypothetical protein
MNDNLLINLLKQKKSIHNDSIDKYLDYLHFDLSSKIYSHGEHFKHPFEKKISFFTWLKNYFRFVKKASYLFYKTNKQASCKLILSTAYFNLEKLNIGDNCIIIRPPWLSINNKSINCLSVYNKAHELLSIINTSSFRTLVDERFFTKIEDYKQALRQYVKDNNIRALFLAHDLGFFEKIAIDIFKESSIPTFNFIHGFPGIYNGIDNNRTDFIVVWGNEIKNNFINNGYLENKIIVNGHPKYKNIEINELKFNFDDILIISKSLISSQYSDQVVLGDRSNLIYYLLSIKYVLKKFNVKKVRFRPHPSENINWYYKYIDRQFFIPDTDPLPTSLSKATLVIGGTSTTFFESLIFGVNFIVYEPTQLNGKLLDGFLGVPPFDGSHKKVPVAKNSQQLTYILEEKLKVDNTILNEYIDNDFNLEIILKHIQNYFKSNNKTL